MLGSYLGDIFWMKLPQCQAWIHEPQTAVELGILLKYPLVMTNRLLLKMAVEIVRFPIEHGDFP